ncbi:transmembrane protein PVRIG isoform X1 [Sciurus carolinensis]|uniref:transmembrane protein PVRIG isoform X1 n=1 Tax=Sciurus carolinensis TaxID=30640 RepID=UPI001FB49164|nr:transmembrane protein PVRIG isoform X1 [Sciurus carolinensis]
MARPRPLVLLWALLTLCISARTPKVWVQVQMEATELPTFTVRCGFLGSGSISLVTVSLGGPDGAGGTSLAVFHPEFGTQQWAPVLQAHWETKSSISLTLEGSMAGSPWANTTICCKFISFPNGSQEACGDKGLPAPSPAPILKADLAGIFGASGVLLCGCIFLLHLVRRQRHRSVAQLRPPLPSSRAQRRAQATSQVALEDPHLPYTPATFHLAAPDTGHPHQQPSRWALPPIHTACPPQVPATRVSRLATPRSSFISVENGLYAGAGARPPCTGPNLGPSPDSLGPRVMGRHLEV